MSIKSITYEDFQSATQSFTGALGPWTGASDPALPPGSSFLSNPAQYCDGACLQLQLFPVKNNEPAWSVTYSANISVITAQYENANALDFTWTYWPMYAASNTLNTTTFPIRTQVNGVSFNDAMVGLPVGDLPSVWPGNLISHSGTTSVNQGSDGIHGYISIVLSYSTVPDEDVTIDQYTKSISFKITTPTQSVASTATTLTSSASGSGLLPLPTFSDGSSPGSPSVSSPNPEPSPQASPSAKMSTGAIIGIAVGSAALLVLIALAFLLYRRRKDGNRLASSEESQMILTAYPHEKSDRPRSIPAYARAESSDAVYAIPIFAASDPLSGNPTAPHNDSQHPATHDTPAATDNQIHPPNYGNEPGNLDYDHVQPAFPALARWANANRALISQDLEARLEAAGYLPTDDPNNLTEEEWIREHNVTKLEVMRIRALYQAQTER